MWFVYLLECADGSFYTGITNDLEKRMKAHAAGTASKYVAAKGFKRLVGSKTCGDRSAALKEEYRIKQLSREKKQKYFSAPFLKHRS